MQQPTPPRPVHENLDTAYVSLAALLRYLQGRDFQGRIHVELDEYEADIYLRAGGRAPRVRERNHATGRETEGEEALHRLLVRARDPGGLISVYESAATAETEEAGAGAGTETAPDDEAAGPASKEERERRDLLHLSGELIAAVERAAAVAGGNFPAAFHAARLQLADDYTFLDPLTNHFEYEGGAVRLHANVGAALFVAGVSEALRRTVDRVAGVEQKIGVRRDVARELSLLRRRRQSALERLKFAPQLERIAGMRLL